MPVAFERGSRPASRPPLEVSYKREAGRQPERRVYREIRSCSLPAVAKRMTSEFIALQEFPGNFAVIEEQGCLVQRSSPVPFVAQRVAPAPVPAPAPVLKEIPAANWTPPVPFRYGMSFVAQPAPVVECGAGQCMCASCYQPYMVVAPFPEGEMLLPFPPKKRRRRGRRGRGARGRKKAAAEAERLAALNADGVEFESDSESS
eukprot:TRINITY_DN615_c0_g1_i1.p1 TRINITY_DN615_c0_g1~~TRINITY_DN615_c0_g1_i1.p1  ORF type:complete len:203 (+),score=39.94 TRINITY_DN615_c0_g1_i1:89-697(+)